MVLNIVSHTIRREQNSIADKAVSTHLRMCSGLRRFAEAAPPRQRLRERWWKAKTRAAFTFSPCARRHAGTGCLIFAQTAHFHINFKYKPTLVCVEIAGADQQRQPDHGAAHQELAKRRSPAEEKSSIKTLRSWSHVQTAPYHVERAKMPKKHSQND